MFPVKFGFFIALFLNITFIYAQREPRWPNLRTTWGMVPSDVVFAKAPKTDFDAEVEEFIQMDDDCAEGKFLGYRYIKESDTGRVLIYDEQGYIAGMQVGIPKSDVLKVNVSKVFFDSPAYIQDKIQGEEQIYFITAYFIDPGRICNGGRTKKEFEEQGIGTSLYLQIGSNPVEDILEVPLREEDLGGTLWTKGPCIKTMGVHYLYNIKGYASCTNIFPIITIYYNGNLIGYEWLAVGNYTFSPRIDKTPPEFIAMVSKQASPPECVKNEIKKSGGLSSLHVFFYDNPWDIDCPGS